MCARLVTPLSETEIKDLGISQLDLNNCSSANSTPIDCKSFKSSINNSNLKKRNYSEYREETAAAPAKLESILRCA